MLPMFVRLNASSGDLASLVGNAFQQKEVVFRSGSCIDLPTGQIAREPNIEHYGQLSWQTQV